MYCKEEMKLVDTITNELTPKEEISDGKILEK